MKEQQDKQEAQQQILTETQGQLKQNSLEQNADKPNQQEAQQQILTETQDQLKQNSLEQNADKPNQQEAQQQILTETQDQLKQNSLEQKTKEDENNQNYSRTSTNTPQSGMSAENMAGNAAVLGGAIAAAAVIPFVGWIVALAILYSFKDKFKDDPKANQDFEDAARSNGLKDEQLNKLKDEAEKYEKGEHSKQQEVGNKIEEVNQKGPNIVLAKTQQDYRKIKDSTTAIKENVDKSNPIKENANTRKIFQQPNKPPAKLQTPTNTERT